MEYSVGQQVAPGLIVIHENTLQQLEELERLQSENVKLRIEAESATDEWRKASANYDSATERRIKAEREVGDFKAQRAMTVARLGGIVEGNPTANHNYLQRVDELVEKERQNVEMLEALRKIHSLATVHDLDPKLAEKVRSLSIVAAKYVSSSNEKDWAICGWCAGTGKEERITTVQCPKCYGAGGKWIEKKA